MSQPPPAHLLLVEDSEDDAFFFRWTLRKCGVPCEVVHLTDGAAAVAHLREVAAGEAARPDVVFLDLKLPRLNGFDVLHWAAEHPLEPPLRIVVLSGSEHVSDVARAGELGAAAYLVKPLSAAQLTEQLTAGPSAAHAATPAASSP